MLALIFIFIALVFIITIGFIFSKFLKLNSRLNRGEVLSEAESKVYVNAVVMPPMFIFLPLMFMGFAFDTYTDLEISISSNLIASASLALILTAWPFHFLRKIPNATKQIVFSFIGILIVAMSCMPALNTVINNTLPVTKYQTEVRFTSLTLTTTKTSKGPRYHSILNLDSVCANTNLNGADLKGVPLKQIKKQDPKPGDILKITTIENIIGNKYISQIEPGITNPCK